MENAHSHRLKFLFLQSIDITTKKFGVKLAKSNKYIGDKYFKILSYTGCQNKNKTFEGIKFCEINGQLR